MDRYFLLFAVFVSVSLGYFPQARAGDSVRSPRAEVRLVSELDAVQPGQEFWVAWHFRLSPKWHTYWKNPGDSGETMRVRWRENPAYRAGSLQFPAPKRIEMPPLANFGYGEEVLILARVQVGVGLRSGDELKLAAEATWLVCEEECIPEKGEFELTLPVRTKAASSESWGRLLPLAAQALPKPWPAGASLFREQDSPQWNLKIPGGSGMLKPGAELDFFPAEPGKIQNVPRPQIIPVGEDLIVRFLPDPILKTPLQELWGLITVRKPGDKIAGYEIRAQAPSAAMAAFSPWALLWALLGGLLLNLMPCVFPVLSLKVLGFFHQGGRSPARARRHAAAYSAGILVSFWMLAGILALLRWSGEQVGWGFQLQSPVFTLILIFLLFWLGLSLLGVFAIEGSWMNWGSSLTQGKGYGSSFFGGVLATVVATPCMAPMVGSSLGVALTQNAGIAWLIFTALGLGLASPYLVLGFFPRLLAWLPKPGSWMRHFERVMGFLILAAVVWLLGVYADLTSSRSLLWLLGALLGLSFAVWLPVQTKWGKGLRLVLALSFLLLAWRNISVSTGEDGSVQAGSLQWEPFSEDRLAELQAAGRPVFINFTASWCLTCQVNERIALRAKSVRDAFAEKNVALLKADWTRQDPEIAQTLRRFGRQGVPLYLLFRRDSQQPEILPELLSPGTVLQALEKI